MTLKTVSATEFRIPRLCCAFKNTPAFRVTAHSPKALDVSARECVLPLVDLGHWVVLSTCRWTCLGTGCSALRAKVAAHYSKILMCASTSFTFQWPPTDTP